MPFGISYRTMLAAAGAEVVAPSDAYIVNSFAPPVVADFAGTLNSGAEYYRVGGSETTFDSIWTFSRAGNATMTDSDGNLKWAPHNLVQRSNSFNANWNHVGNAATTAGQSDPDGGSTATRLSCTANGDSKLTLTPVTTALVSGAKYKQVFFAKYVSGSGWVRPYNSNGGGGYAPYHSFDVQNGVVGTGRNSTGTITSLGGGWYLCESEFVASTTVFTEVWIELQNADDSSVANSGDAIDIFGFHVYRSDLGGMVDNPDRGDSYVPTTTAAVYQARRNHYRYNGSTYDNKGILLESEARTNLITQSDVMSGWTTSNMTVAKNQAGADGVANSAHSLTATSGSATVLTTITAASNPHVYSALVKRITGTGTIEMTVNNGSTWVDVTSLINSSEFIQVGTGAGVTVTNPTVGFRITTSGDAIAVQINQLEQTSGRFSSPIPTSGATVTRAAETLTPDAAVYAINGTDFSWHIKGTLNYQTNNNEVLSLYTNTSNYNLARFATDGDLDVFNFTSAGTGTDKTTTFASVNLSAGDVFDYSIASRTDSGTETNAALNGTAGTAGSYGTTPDFTTTSNLYLNGQPFTRPPMHNIELLRIWTTADIGDTGIESATS